MMIPTASWAQANQRCLSAALGRIRARLDAHASLAEPGAEAEARSEQRYRAACDSMPGPSALDALTRAFGLSAFERDLLLLCAGTELESGFAAACAVAQGDAQRAYPTFSLALAALREPHWSALAPASPLRRWRLVEVGLGDSLTKSQLRIDERVLHYLTGVESPDERLAGVAYPLDRPKHLPQSHARLVRRIGRLWRKVPPNQELPATELCGGDSVDRLGIAAAALAEIGLNAFVMRPTDVPASPAEREGFARLWERESIISGSGLVIDCDGLEGTEGVRSAAWAADRFRGAIVIAGHDPVALRRRQHVRFDVRKPTTDEQTEMWRSSLGRAARKLNGELALVVDQFDLSARDISAAGRAAAGRIGDRNADRPTGIGDVLWDACRLQARPRLDDLAQRIESNASWDELVLPDVQKAVLRNIAVHVRRRAKVYDEWGFAVKGSRGLGISALFAGASGTGKTMAAEVLANELRLDLYRIDLSSVVSKYIGETEKNLRRVFDAAEGGGAILLFDEADALFGKRSEVKDSHDRYANIEISYLLQRMEMYRGLAILTTNQKAALDQAFLRRIRFIVHFPFPDAAQRAEIWRHVFPAETPTRDIDPEKLSQLSVTGGNIRNIAMNAAFLAADGDEPVAMAHLLRAAQSEYQKLEMPLTNSDIGGWM